MFFVRKFWMPPTLAAIFAQLTFWFQGKIGVHEYANLMVKNVGVITAGVLAVCGLVHALSEARAVKVLHSGEFGELVAKSRHGVAGAFFAVEPVLWSLSLFVLAVVEMVGANSSLRCEILKEPFLVATMTGYFISFARLTRHREVLESLQSLAFELNISKIA